MDDKLPKYLEPSQVRLIIEQARRRSTRDFALLLTVYKYGLRSTEAKLLDLSDLNFESNRIKVTRCKGSVSAEYPLFRDVRSALEEYIATRRDKCPALFKGLRGRLSRRMIAQIFTDCAEAVGVTLRHGQSIHSLRHSIAVHALEAHRPVEEIKDLLGHSKIQSTLIYARISDAKRRAMVVDLEDSEQVVNFSKSQVVKPPDASVQHVQQ